MAPSSMPKIPPKKYEDIYPLDFETDDWQAMWDELKSIFLFWIEKGIQIFRVDNPHTKSINFWGWVIGEIRRDHPGCHFPGRSIHPAQGDVPAGQTGLHPVVYLFYLAKYQGRTHPLHGKTDHIPRWANFSGPTCGPTRPTSCRNTSR